jgi:hypothetical protein
LGFGVWMNYFISFCIGGKSIVFLKKEMIKMATIQKKATKRIIKSVAKKKTDRAGESTKKQSRGFEKAWEFWKTAQLDLSNFKFDREEANAR